MALRPLAGAAHDFLLRHETGYADGRETRRRRADPIRVLRNPADGAASQRQIADRVASPGVGNRLMVELAVFTSAACRRSLDSGVGPATARQQAADTGGAVIAGLLRVSSWPFRAATGGPDRALRWTISSVSRFPFGAPGTPVYGAEIRVVGDDIVTEFTYRRLCARSSRHRVIVAIWTPSLQAGADTTGRTPISWPVTASAVTAAEPRHCSAGTRDAKRAGTRTRIQGSRQCASQPK